MGTSPSTLIRETGLQYAKEDHFRHDPSIVVPVRLNELEAELIKSAAHLMNRPPATYLRDSATSLMAELLTRAPRGGKLDDGSIGSVL